MQRVNNLTEVIWRPSVWLSAYLVLVPATSVYPASIFSAAQDWKSWLCVFLHVQFFTGLVSLLTFKCWLVCSTWLSHSSDHLWCSVYILDILPAFQMASNTTLCATAVSLSILSISKSLLMGKTSSTAALPFDNIMTSFTTVHSSLNRISRARAPLNWTPCYGA